MTEPLQEFDFRHSRYERPNRKWVCGWARAGEPCPIGPDSRGQCQGHRECVPYKQGDAYRCARPGHLGGACRQGPDSDGTCSQQVIPCQPVRGWMARRKLTTYLATMLALGACLLMFGGSNESLTSPGELTLQHHGESQTCADCHAAAENGFADWINSTLHPETAHGDSRRCLNCHGELGAFALQAHGVPWEELVASRQRQSRRGKSEEPWQFAAAESLAKLAPGIAPDPQSRLACAACHHEHRGADFDLTRMSNRQCQACHSVRFASFSRGHPEFHGYPYDRRTRLRFDHATHYGTHFATYRRVAPEAAVPDELTQTTDQGLPAQQSCTVCHQPDPAVKTMPIRGFEQSCAACHESRMQADLLPGVAFFSLPGGMTRLLFAEEVHIGQWPDLKTSTNELPAYMELLLRSDPDAAAALDELSENDWGRLGSLEAERAEWLAWSVKRLIYDIVQNGRPAVERRLRSVLGESLPAGHLRSLSGEVANAPDFVDALSEAQRRWFPNLAEEFEAHSEGRQIESAAVEVSTNAEDTEAGWYAETIGGAIRYRATGHADELIRAWLETTARRAHVADRIAPGKAPLSNAAASEGASQSGGVSRMSAAARLFVQLSDRSRPFRCMDCHTADRQTDGSLKINWFASRASGHAQHFTRFSHAPHVTLLARESCAACHRLEPEIRFFRPEFLRVREKWTINTNPHSILTSGFLSVSRTTCAKCHVKQRAGDRCLKCHNYHVRQ